MKDGMNGWRKSVPSSCLMTHSYQRSSSGGSGAISGLSSEIDQETL